MLGQAVAVAASYDNDNAISFTDSNEATDLFAPGVGITSYFLDNSQLRKFITSLLAPRAACCAALLIQNGEGGTLDEIESRLNSASVAKRHCVSKI